MPCETFEDLLNGYGELRAVERAVVDAHLAVCPDCRNFHETLTALDEDLTTLYSGAEPSRAFDPASVKRPSPLPEMLDFVGWAAIAAIVIILGVITAARFGYILTLPPSVGWYAAGTGAILLAALNRILTKRIAAVG